jgi:3-oxoacyl-[acyl-carrier-protein] synthase II
MSAKALYYINGVGVISPQKTFDNHLFLPEVTAYNQNILTCIAPDFKQYINPIQLRRLSNLLRTGLSAAIICLRDAGITVPDGIVTATGYGSLKETELYMNELLSRNESQLTPTYFMQGTYNALAGLIALTVKCMGYNNTFVSKGFAFETALQDAMFQVADAPSANYLVGGYDETATARHAIGLREQHFKKEHINSAELYDSETVGTLEGEGSAFFVLSGKPSPTTWCTLNDVEMIFKPTHHELSAALETFLSKHSLTIADVDVWISGISGDKQVDGLLVQLQHTTLKNIPALTFKHLCGEYTTAVTFALWLGASLLRKQYVPASMQTVSQQLPAKLNTVLIVNQYMNRNYSFLLLQKASA